MNPRTIENFRKAKAFDTVKVLETIHQDEITHVACGQKWFTYLVALDGSVEQRYAVFHGLVKTYFHGALKPPFNHQDRIKAGLDGDYYIPLSESMA